MAATVSKAGPYYSSGEIKFSDLRRDFRAQVKKNSSGSSVTINSSKNSGSIKASELLRITSTSNTNPVVPNATENSSIATSSNWKLSQFRNSIKFYYITQSGTDINFDIDSQSWNSNLTKNINKVAFIDGTCGSNSTSSEAAGFNATTYNLTIDVFGEIYGAGGAGGTSSSTDGGNGGNALRASSSSGNNLVVNVRSGAKIYAGGGGGAAGATGATGGNGKCYNETTVQACAPGPPGCPGGYTSIGTWSGGCCQSTCDYCWGCCERCVQWLKYRKCKQEYTTSGGAGGAGGNGGKGRGYDNPPNIIGGGLFVGIDVSLLGDPGSAGSPSPDNPSCGAQSGGTGGTGATGGDWNQDGGDTAGVGDGGAPGKAIFGVNYSVTGTINSSTVKGVYNP